MLTMNHKVSKYICMTMFLIFLLFSLPLRGMKDRKKCNTKDYTFIISTLSLLMKTDTVLSSPLLSALSFVVISVGEPEPVFFLNGFHEPSLFRGSQSRSW